VLPLDRTRGGSLVVVGDLAAMANLGDYGSALVAPVAAVTPLDGILAGAGAMTVTHLAGPPLPPGAEGVIGAADAVVVVAGLDFFDEGEGYIFVGDRASLDLADSRRAGQVDLITEVATATPRTIVVLEGSGPFAMPWLPAVQAVLTAWYPGAAGGTAIAEVLFGDVNPSGRLPLSFPVAETDLPPFDNTSPVVPYGLFHGYRWLDRTGAAPLFPFGFGLSYTTFAHANLQLARTAIPPDGRLRLTVDVTNTGARAGAEVVQVYVAAEGSAVERAPKVLADFARVHLEAGETRTVPLEVRAADLAYYDVVAGAWQTENLTYRVRVGRSDRDLPLEASFTIAP
jgi:beta-glucosidase